MIRRSRVISIGYNLGLGLLALALAFVSFDSPAQAQSADLVLCDRIAADPSDPDKPKDVKGTADIAPSDIAIAIKYCKVASASSRRALYALGRAYAANKQLPDAIGAYRKAADKGSTSAMVELGVMLATGSGMPKDPAQARKLFERAAEAGDPRGIANLMALSSSGGGGKQRLGAECGHGGGELVSQGYRRVERMSLQAHLRSRQYIPLPGLHAHIRAATQACDKHCRKHDRSFSHFPFSSSPTISCSRAARSASRNPIWERSRRPSRSKTIDVGIPGIL